MNDITQLKKLLTPYDLKHEKIRIGPKYDGGYVVDYDVLKQIDAVYSLGIGTECDFDLQLATMGYPIFMYEANFPEPPKKHDNFHYKQMFITSETIAAEFINNNHTDDKNLMLSMDIEGGEYELIGNISLENLGKFSQIVMEIHDVLHNPYAPYILEKINTQFLLCHIHANNNCISPGAFSSGMIDGMPNVLELTYINKNTLIDSQSYPIENLDYKNQQHLPDVALNWWVNPQKESTEIKIKNAIVCLARGYDNIDNYNMIIARNIGIYNHINQKRENKYPLIIFHEGNFTEEHQQHINKHTPDQEIKYVDISDIWVGGYESMCRFNAYDVWNLCDEYGYILRIDDDCVITKCETDPFDMVGDNVYLKSIFWHETHPPTNETLPDFISQKTGLQKEDFYTHDFPYTNVSLSSVNFWKQPEIAAVLKDIAMHENQRSHRWGDLPILGSLLNIYAKDSVGTLTGFSYMHISHNMMVDC